MPSTDGNPLALGGVFTLDGERFATKGYLSLDKVLATKQSDGSEQTILVQDIVRLFARPEDPKDLDEVDATGIEQLSEDDWKEAERRQKAMTILIEAAKPTRALVAAIAKELGRSVATIYKWRAVYGASKNIADLAPHHPSGGRGKPRIEPTAQEVTQEVIAGFFMNKQRLKPAKVMEEVETRCHKLGIKPPHINTLRRRLAAIPERKRLSAREGKQASEKFEAVPGRFPGADRPNAVWQIDHTPVDICIVDDVYRRNIGRCWITVAIDVFSRCVVGFYLSLDKPNATSVGMCLVHAILPKQGWLAAHGIELSWPNWGKPVTVHADNDKTFRCDMVTRAAKSHGINLEWRPVRKPRWGGHIERLLGTFNTEIHSLPGTTFSSPEERGEYKPHEEAALTFMELEKYIALYLVGRYHIKFHNGIKRSPIKKYEGGILGDGVALGIGLPEPEKDPFRLRLDFLPLKTPTVQSNGITWDGITYYDPVLDPWIHAKDPENPNEKRKFICRRDPRDISIIWFLDPEKDTYFKIPYRNCEHPSINLWELLEVKRQIKQEGWDEVDEELLFATYDRLQNLVREASQETQRVRKATQKKKTHAQKARQEQAQVDQASERPAGPTPISQRSGSSVPEHWDDDDEVALYTESKAS